jgi:sarcosine oxidase/L-pipecolate oxidase
MWFQFAEDSPDGTSNLFYGFPSVPWGPPNSARIAVDAASRILKDPVQRSPDSISPQDLENTRQFVMKHIKGAGRNPVPFFAGQCLQTNVFDNMFVLDTIPDYLIPNAGPERSNSIAVFTAGWAMKFVPLIGLILKQLLVDGETADYDISQFKMDRKGKDGQHIVQQKDIDLTADIPTPYAGSSYRSCH